jgi:formate/nitrite transporter FocA (FNT family)
MKGQIIMAMEQTSSVFLGNVVGGKLIIAKIPNTIGDVKMKDMLLITMSTVIMNEQ